MRFDSWRCCLFSRKMTLWKIQILTTLEKTLNWIIFLLRFQNIYKNRFLKFLHLMHITPKSWKLPRIETVKYLNFKESKTNCVYCNLDKLILNEDWGEKFQAKIYAKRRSYWCKLISNWMISSIVSYPVVLQRFIWWKNTGMRCLHATNIY